MRITTKGGMLNFGYWTDIQNKPLQAQLNLTEMLGRYGNFDDARSIIDLGSGFSIPAMIWSDKYPKIRIYCIDINFQHLNKWNRQLSNSMALIEYNKTKPDSFQSIEERLTHINATFSMIPFCDESVDRVVAFESAQHFKPLKKFLQESYRVLKENGILIIALPIINYNKLSLFSVPTFFRLGTLSLTWISEHYNLTQIRTIIKDSNLMIEDITYIGSHVYIPLADYYIKNRSVLRKEIMEEYPDIFERIIYYSILKMKNASEKGLIEYILIKVKKNY